MTMESSGRFLHPNSRKISFDIRPLPIESAVTPQQHKYPSTPQELDEISRWAQAEEVFLEQFFGKERGVGKRDYDAPRSSRVTFYLNPHVRYDSPHFVEGEDDACWREGLNVPSLPAARVLRPKTADLSAEHRTRLNSFRELDKLVFVRPTSAAVQNYPAGPTSADEIVCGNRGRRIRSARRAMMLGDEPSDDLLLPRKQRPLSRETKSRLLDIIGDVLQVPWKPAPVISPKPGIPSILWDDDDEQPIENNRRLGLPVDIEETTCPQVSFRAPAQLSQHQIPSEYFDKNDGHVILSQIVRRYPVPKAVRGLKRLTPIPSLMAAAAEIAEPIPEMASPQVAFEDPVEVFRPPIATAESHWSFQGGLSSHGKRNVGQIFPLDFFMDFEDVQKYLVEPLRKNSEGIATRARLAALSTPSTAEDPEPALNFTPSYYPCTVLSYHADDARFKVRWERSPLPGRKHFPTYLTRTDLLLPNETPHAHRLKLLRARELRVDFEYHLALRQFSAILRPFLRSYIPDTPFRMAEGVFTSVIHQSFLKQPDTQNDSDIHPSEDAEYMMVKLSPEGDMWQYPPDFLINLRAEIWNDFIRSQVQAAVLQSSHLRTFLPDQNDSSALTANAVHWSLDCEPIECVERGYAGHRIEELEARIDFYFVKCRDSIRQLREDCTRCLEMDIMRILISSRKTGPKLTPEPFIITPAYFMQLCGQWKLEFTKALNTTIPSAVKSAVLSAETAHNLQCDVGSDELRSKDIETAKSLICNFVSYFAKGIVSPLCRLHALHIYKAFHHGDLRIILPLKFHQDASNGLYSIQYCCNLEDTERNLKDAGTLESQECILPSGRYNPLPEDYKFLQELYNETLEDGIRQCNTKLHDLQAFFVQRMESAVQMPMPILEIQSAQVFINSCEAHFKAISQIEHHAKAQPSISACGPFTVDASELKTDLQHWSTQTREQLLQHLLQLFKKSVADLLETRAHHKVPRSPKTFKETKQAIQSYLLLQKTVSAIRVKSDMIRGLKGLLDGYLRNISDEDSFAYYEAYTVYSKLEASAEKRKQAIDESVLMLQAMLATNISDLRTQCAALLSSVDELLGSNIPGLPETSSMADSDDEDRLIEEDEAVREAEPAVPPIVEQFSPAIEHMKTLLAVSRTIQEDAECIEDSGKIADAVELMKQIQSKMDLVNVLTKYRLDLQGWCSTVFTNIDAAQVRAICQEYLVKFAHAEFSGFPIVKYAQYAISSFLRNECPILDAMAYDQFHEWHWDAIKGSFELEDFDRALYTLNDVIETVGRRNLAVLHSDLSQVLQEAEAERSVSQTLEDMQTRFAQLKFETGQDEASGLTVIHRFEFVMSVVESDLMSVGMLVDGSSEPGVDHYIDSLLLLQKDLQLATTALTEWSITQPLLLSTHTFFSATEVRVALPLETKRFNAVETTYRALLAKAEKNTGMKALVDDAPDLAEGLRDMRDVLKKLVGDVQGWLDGKRIGFPRLFFSADEELLELVKVKREPKELSLHLSKCFHFTTLVYQTSGVGGQDFKITGIRAGPGDILMFRNPISMANLSLEELLTKIEAQIQATLKEILFELLRSEEKDSQKDSIPSQLQIIIYQIHRTKELSDPTLLSQSGFIEQLLGQVQTFIRLMGPKHTIHARNLLTLAIQHRDWLQALQHERALCKDLQKSVVWLENLRYHYDEDEVSINLSQYVYKAQYGFEYIPACKRIAFGISSRGFQSIWLALQTNKGLVATGPPTVGKTTNLLEFTYTVGRFAVVYSCSNTVDGRMLRRALTGMVMTGSFLIMRNIERLGHEALNVCLNAILAVNDIMKIVRKDVSSLMFLGRVIKLPPVVHARCLATCDDMSDPAFSGIIRTQMIPIQLRVPSIGTIATLLLRKAGIAEWDRYSRKMAAFWRACEGLSLPIGGICSLVSICKMIEKRRGTSDELQVIRRCIFDWASTRFTGEDFQIFENLLNTSICAAGENPSPGPLLGRRMTEMLDLDQISPLHTHIADVIEGILRTTRVSGAQILVSGASQTGKTSAIGIAATRSAAQLVRINPVAISQGLLFGATTPAGHSKGIVEGLLAHTEKFFIHMDGPLMASWTDSISSIIPPGTLCLPTGKRLSLPENMVLIVESENLSEVSLGFISRFQIVHVHKRWLWHVALAEWLFGLSSAYFKGDASSHLSIQSVAGMYLGDVVDALDHYCETHDTVRRAFAGFTNIFQAVCTEAQTLNPRWKACIEDYFWFAAIWSFGLEISVKDRASFQKRLVVALDCQNSQSRLAIQLESNRSWSIFELNLHIDTGNWGIDHDRGVITRFQPLATLLLRYGSNVLLCGVASSGKTSSAENILEMMLDQKFAVHTHAMHPKSQSSDFTSHLQKNLIKDESGTVYGPPNGKSLIVFIDDLHIESESEQGSSVQEFWRSFIDCGGYWSDGCNFRRVRKVAVLGVSDTWTLKRRLTRHFVCLPFQDEDVLEATRQQYSEHLLHKGNKVQLILAATLRSHTLLQQRCLGNSFCSFKPRDVAKVFNGLLRVDDEDWRSNKRLIRAWSHEMERTYKDRIDEIDFPTYLATIRQVSLQYLHQVIPEDSRSVYYSDITTTPVIPNDKDTNRSIFNLGFTGVMKQSNAMLTQTAYMERSTYREVEEDTIKEAISIFTAQNETRNLISRNITSYRGAIDQFCRLDRVLGSKRRSGAIAMAHMQLELQKDIVKLCAAMRGYKYREFTVSEISETVPWHTFIRRQILEATIAQQKVVVGITLPQGSNLPHGILGDVNALMDHGRSAQLWSASEYEDVLTKVAHQAKNNEKAVNTATLGKEGTATNEKRLQSAFDTERNFNERTLTNLKIILLFDARDLAIWKKISQYPKLVSAPDLTMYRDMPAEGLADFANHYLTQTGVNEATKSDGLEVSKVSLLSTRLYSAVIEKSSNWSTSARLFSLRSFEDHLQRFSSSYQQKRRSIQDQLKRYSNCLERVLDGKTKIASTIDATRKSLKHLPEELRRTALELEEVRSRLRTSEATVKELRYKLKLDEDLVGREWRERQQTLADGALDAARRMLENSQKRLQALRKDAFQELRTEGELPASVVMLSNALCILFDRPPSWAEARKILASHSFLHKLLGFGPDTVSDVTLMKLKLIVEASAFRPDRCAVVGVAAKELCSWIATLYTSVRETRRVREEQAQSFSKNQKRMVGSADSQEKIIKTRDKLLIATQEEAELREKHDRLQNDKRELVGRIALLEEIFAPTGIFERHEPGEVDHISESQWIQQAFHGDDDGPIFDNGDVAKAHENYAKAVQELGGIQGLLSADIFEGQEQSKQIRTLLSSLTLDDITTLMDLGSSNPFVTHARSILLDILQLPEQSSVPLIHDRAQSSDVDDLKEIAKRNVGNSDYNRTVYYDKNAVSSRAIMPYTAPKGAMTVFDIATAVRTYKTRHQQVVSQLQYYQEKVKQEKKTFDNIWCQKYEVQAAFWPFEVILQTLKSVRKRLEETDRDLMRCHITAQNLHPLLEAILRTSCAMIGWNADAPLLAKWILRNPQLFLREMANIRFSDSQVLNTIQDNLKEYNLANILSATRKHVDSIYFDIVGQLPQALSLKILSLLDSRTLAQSFRVNQPWSKALVNMQFWRWMCLKRGWGIAFSYPNNLSWKAFYFTLDAMTKSRLTALKPSVTHALAGLMGFKAYARMTTYLKKLPEYAQLGRLDKGTVVTSDMLISYELANDLFVAVENAFSDYLHEDGTAPSIAGQPTRQSRDKHSSLRNYMLVAHSETTDKTPVPDKFIHEFIMKKARKNGVFNATIDRLRKQLPHNRGGIVHLSLNANVSDLFKAPAQQVTVPVLASSRTSIFSLLAELFQAIFVFHNGKRTGKYLQFQNRFSNSLGQIGEDISKRIADLSAAEKTLLGDSLLQSAFLTYLGPFPPEKRLELFQEIESIISQEFPDNCRSFKFRKTESPIHDALFLQKSKVMRENIALITSQNQDIWILDPDGLIEPFLDSTKLFPLKGEVQKLDARAPNFIDQLAVLKSTWKPIIITNLQDDLISSQIVKIQEQRKKERRPGMSAEMSMIVVSKLSSFTTQTPEFFSVINCCHSSETTCSIILDKLMNIVRPSFDLQGRAQRVNVRSALKKNEESFQSCISMMLSSNITESDPLMHDIIVHQRNSYQSERNAAIYRTFKSHNEHLFKPFHHIAIFSSTLKSYVKGVEALRPLYGVTDHMLFTCIEDAVSPHAALLQSGTPKKEDLDVIKSALTAAVLVPTISMIQAADREPVVLATLLLLANNLSVVSHFDSDFFKKCIVHLTPEEFLAEEVMSRLPKSGLGQRPAFQQLVEAAVTAQKQQVDILKDHEVSTQYHRRVGTVERALLLMLFYPDSISQVLDELMQATGVRLLPPGFNRNTLFGKFHMPIKVLVTNSSKDVLHVISSSLDDQEHHSTRLVCLGESDKQDNIWREKIERACVEGDWVVVHLDHYWISKISEFSWYARKVQAGGLVWMVCPEYMQHLLPSGLAAAVNLLFLDKDQSLSILVQDLAHNYVSSPHKLPLPVNRALYSLVYTHAATQSMALTWNNLEYSTLKINFSDFQLATFLTTQLVNLGVSPDVIEEICVSVIYLKEVTTLEEETPINAGRLLILALLERYTNASELDIVTYENFERSFKNAQHNSVQNLWKLRMESHQHNRTQMTKHFLGVLRKLMIHDERSESDYGPHASKVPSPQLTAGSLWNGTPKFVKLRDMYESVNRNDTEMARLIFLRQANSFNKAIHTVRDGLKTLILREDVKYCNRSLASLVNDRVPDDWISSSAQQQLSAREFFEELAALHDFIHHSMCISLPKILSAKLPMNPANLAYAAMITCSQKYGVAFENLKALFAVENLQEAISTIFMDRTLYPTAYGVTDWQELNACTVNGVLQCVRPGYRSQLPCCKLFIEVAEPDLRVGRHAFRPVTSNRSSNAVPLQLPITYWNSVSNLLPSISEVPPELVHTSLTAPVDALLHRVSLCGSKSPLTMGDTHQMEHLNWPNDLCFIPDRASEALGLMRSITVYLCTSKDMENERSYFYDCILPHVRAQWLRRKVLLLVVDFQHGHPVQQQSNLDYLAALKWQIKRTDIALCFVGNTIETEPGQDVSLFEKELAIVRRHISQLLSNFYIRDPSFARSVPKSFRAQYLSNDFESTSRLNLLKLDLVENSHRDHVHNYQAYFSRIENRKVRMGGLENFGKQLTADLNKAIVQRELEYCAWLPHKTSIPFAGRTELLTKIRNILAFASFKTQTAPVISSTGVHRGTILVYGEAGCGKTELFSQIVRGYQKTKCIMLTNFVRTWNGSFSAQHMLKRFHRTLSRQLGIFERTHTLETFDEIKSDFKRLLQIAAELDLKVLILVDGIDRVLDAQTRRLDIKWLPLGSEMNSQLFDSVRFLFSANDLKVKDSLQRIHPHADFLHLGGLSPNEQTDIFRRTRSTLPSSMDDRHIRTLITRRDLSKPLFLASVLAKLRRIKNDGTVNLDDIPFNTNDIFAKILSDLEIEHGKNMANVLRALATARSGLREVEVVGLLKLPFVSWNLIFQSLEDLVVYTESGHLIPFHEDFSNAIRNRYFKSAKDTQEQHRIMAEYFMSVCYKVAGKYKIWRDYDYSRSLDIVHHQLSANFSLEIIVQALCSLSLLRCAYLAESGYEIVTFLGEVMKRAQMEGQADAVAKLSDYSFFVETYGKYLRPYPDMIFTLAYNLPKTFCPSVREDAIKERANDKSRRLFLHCVTASESQVESIIIGQHPTKVITSTITIQKELRKCCMTVSDDGTIKAWDVDSYFLLRTVLASPFPPGTATQCCLSPGGAEYAAFALASKDVCLFDLSSGALIFIAEGVYNGGLCFFSEGKHNLWQRSPLGQLEQILFADIESLAHSRTELIARAPDRCLEENTCNMILAVSSDHSRLAVLSERKQCVIVLHASKLRELCRFNETRITQNSTACFSLSHDLLAATRDDGQLTIWRIDNRSRIALIQLPEEFSVQTLCFSADETVLLCGSSSGVIHAVNIQNGRLLRKISSGAASLSGICVGTSRGKERFFLTLGNRLLVCNNSNWKSLGQQSSDTPGSEIVHKKAVLQIELFGREQNSSPGNSAEVGVISTSSDETFILWMLTENRMTFSPKRVVPMGLKGQAIAYSKDDNYLVVVGGASVSAYDMNTLQIALQLNQEAPLRTASLVRLKTENHNLFLCTWDVTGLFTAWQVLRRPDRSLAHHTSPVFQRHATVVPKNLLSPDGSKIVLGKGQHVYVLDLQNGYESTSFQTNGQEVRDIYWTPTGIAYCSTSDLWLDNTLWSSGGVHGDFTSIQSCLAHRNGKHLAYAGIDTEQSAYQIRRSTVSDIGIIVVMQQDVPQRYCTLRHESGRILHWSFTDDGLYIVTIGSDHIMRVWSLKDTLDSGHDKNPAKSQFSDDSSQRIVAMYPTNDPTCMTVGGGPSPVIFVGNSRGDVSTFVLTI
ncbi:hypothetical protein DFS34DRAFT_698061 [Phlyctochytrium arcticum]|nr:hypothetical protein DFS34DRAFT_698061 [Phlyctochytrium arcticum]